MKNKYVRLIISIAIPLVVGGLSGWLTANEFLADWFVHLTKPSFNPPSAVFGPVWTTLYILMGISLYLVWQSPSSPMKQKAIWSFAVQLFLNFWWSIIFFSFHQIGWALVCIAAILTAIVVMIIYFFKVKPLAAYLQIPYLLWVSFATILNAAFWYLNV